MMGHDARLVAMAYASGAPAVVAAIVALFAGDIPSKIRWTVSTLVVGVWLIVPWAFREQVLGRLRTMATVLEAFREGDYSVRTRDRGDGGALGDLSRELNALGDALRSHRLDAAEANALLHKVIATIEAVVIAVDDAGIVRLANAAADRLLGERAVGRSAAELGLGPLLAGDAPRVLTPQERDALGARGAMDLRRNDFRQDGKPHTLLVLSDVGRALRQKEREAWQGLVRVLGHEINSSLSPIQSLAESLASLLSSSPRADDWEDDLASGLAVIGRRAAGLSRFMTAYARLAKLPPPVLVPVDVAALVARAAALDQRMPVHVDPGPAVTIAADADQLDQLLINLVKNAVDAVIARGEGEVRMGWSQHGRDLAITIDDEGDGIGDTANLFVPFFTTKPEGSGIGLVLARQIAESHGGSLTLDNRPDGQGARATLHLPAP